MKFGQKLKKIIPISLATILLNTSAHSEPSFPKTSTIAALPERVHDLVCGDFRLEYDLEKRVATIKPLSENNASYEFSGCEEVERKIAGDTLSRSLKPAQEQIEGIIDFEKAYRGSLVEQLWNSKGTHALDLDGDTKADLIVRVPVIKNLGSNVYRMFFEYTDGKLTRKIKKSQLNGEPNSTTAYEYYADGKLKKEITNDTFIQKPVTRLFEYHPGGGMKKSRETSFGKNDRPRLIYEWDPEGRETGKFIYDSTTGKLMHGNLKSFKEGGEMREESYDLILGNCEVRVGEFNQQGEKIKEYVDLGCDGIPDKCGDKTSTMYRECRAEERIERPKILERQ